MALANNLTSREFGRRFRKALSVPFLLNQVCSNNIQEFVSSYAASLGCTEKCFFFPLLSCAAACMGMECCVELTKHWQEPPVVWTLVVTQRSLLRMDVAEHLKTQLLLAQNEAYVLGKNEDTKDYLKKFLFDMFTLSQLQDMLRLSNGHGLAIYNSVRSLHKNMSTPEDADIMVRLHSGLGWFSDSRVGRSTVFKTRVNFAVISSPSTVHQTLISAPNFQELFQQCFLVACAEENHVKFGQISEKSEVEKLREIFVSLLKLHSVGSPIVYKLSDEAKEKFSQIHDELTDKAKQMARKNGHKIFQPAVAYLGRLSMILHVVDAVIDAINYKVPISRLTWSTEISANTVWQARELLGHIIEQRHALMESTTIEATQQKATPTPIQIDGRESQHRTPTMHTSPRTIISPMNRTPSQAYSPRHSFMFSNNNSQARRNIMNNPRPRVSNTFSNLQNQSTILQPAAPPVPIIASVHSGALPVPNEAPTFNPVISTCETMNPLNAELNLPSSLSISVSEEAESGPPALLSREPFASILDLPQEDFLKTHRSSMKRLLKHETSEITPSRCVQLKLTPDPTASDETQKYSQSFCRSFMKYIEKLGFGICEGPKNGNLRHFVFKKKKFSALNEEQTKMLADLNITEVEYNKCFTTTTPHSQNGKVVCLE